MSAGQPDLDTGSPDNVIGDDVALALVEEAKSGHLYVLDDVDELDLQPIMMSQKRTFNLKKLMGRNRRCINSKLFVNMNDWKTPLESV